MKIDFLILSLLIVFLIIPVTASPLADVGDYVNVYDYYGYSGGVMTDNSGVTFENDTNGLIEINGVRHLGFMIDGTYNSINYTYTSMQFNWKWEYEVDDNNYIFHATNNNNSFLWNQTWYFYEDPNIPMKIEHYIENNYPNNITNMHMYYIISVTGTDTLAYTDSEYLVSSLVIPHTVIDSPTSYIININREFNFDFTDLVADNFDIELIYVGPGSIIDVPGNIMAVKFTKGGGTLAAGAGVTIDPTISAVNPSDTGTGRRLARESDGTLWTVYRGTNNGIYAISSTNDGDTWGTPELVNDSSSSIQTTPSIAIDSDDNLHVIWSGLGWGTNTADYNIQYKKKTTTWGSQVGITDESENQLYPVIAVNSTDALHIAWAGLGYSLNNTNYNIQYKSYVSSWGTREAITDIGEIHETPCISIDSNDDIHLVWMAGYDTQYRKRTSSGWGTRGDITSDTQNNYYPSVSIDSNDIAHVVWHGIGYAPNFVMFTISYSNSSNWGNRETVVDSTNSPREASISIDSNDVIHVLINEYTINDLTYRNRTSGVWGTKITISSETSEQRFPNALWAMYPTVAGVQPNIPENGASFVWLNTSGTDSMWFDTYPLSGVDYQDPMIPATPINIANTTQVGEFWINWTFQSGSGTAIDDSYNTSISGVGWTNGSSNFYHNATSLDANTEYTINIYAYNNTWGLSASSLSDSMTVPNNVPVLIDVSSSYELYETSNFTIDANFTDLDGGSVTFTDNSSDWDIGAATGLVVWNDIDYNDVGDHNYKITINDGFGGTDYMDFTVTILGNQNTVLSMIDSTFNATLAGTDFTENEIPVSFSLTNSGSLDAVVTAKFTSSYSGTYGFVSGTETIPGTNFKLGNETLDLLRADTDSVTLTDGVPGLDTEILYGTQIKIPSNQDALEYRGTIELTFDTS